GAVSVMMRIVFLLFAEERGLLPSDNDLYASAYSAGGLLAELERRATEGTEDDLEHTSERWLRLLALFRALYHGVEHERLTLPAYDGSLFDPEEFPWLPLDVDDRTVLHMLRAVQYVRVGTGRSRETRSLSFATLDVEQIGYVYEGLLSFEGFRASDVTVGLTGRAGLEEEVALADLETIAERADGVPALAAALADRYRESGIGSPAALVKKLAPQGAGGGDRQRRRAGRAAAAVRRHQPPTPARPAGGDPARRAVRHRVSAAAQHRHSLPPAVAGRAGRRGRAGAAGLPGGTAADRR